MWQGFFFFYLFVIPLNFNDDYRYLKAKLWSQESVYSRYITKTMTKGSSCI